MSLQSWSQNVSTAWQQVTTSAGHVAKHPAGLFGLGALVAVFVLTVIQRVVRTFGWQNWPAPSESHSNDGRSNPFRAILELLFPRKKHRPRGQVWPGLLPSSDESQPHSDGGLGTREQVRSTDRTVLRPAVISAHSAHQNHRHCRMRLTLRPAGKMGVMMHHRKPIWLRCRVW